MSTKKKKHSSGGKKGPRTWAYPTEFRLRVVKLFLEEGLQRRTARRPVRHQPLCHPSLGQGLSTAWRRGV